MRVKLVTAYVPIAGHPRGPAEYGALGETLSGVPVPKKAFYDQVQNLWLSRHLRTLKFIPSSSEYDNPAKNSLAYHCVNHEKSKWLVDAANDDPEADVLCWVDYGIFRLPGVNNQAITEFIHSLDDKHIYAPGCWDKPLAVESSYPCWRFCGSVLAVPRTLVDAFHFECRARCSQHILATKNVEWEVNSWARVEAGKRKLPFKWYKADHDVSMFTNCPTLAAPDQGSVP
jgi:hypothetical protein